MPLHGSDPWLLALTRERIWAEQSYRQRGRTHYNEVEGKKRNIPPPKTWSDLTNPIYKGQIVMPHPVSSGTGFMYVVAWLQAYGEAAGWKLMDGLHENISRYTHSGSAPAVIAARGEQVVGLAFELRGSRLKEEGAPISMILPTEALGLDMNAIALVKGSKKLEAAKTLMNWAVSPEAMKIYGATRSVVAVPGMASAPTTGRLVADLVAGRRPFIDPSPYRPDRF